MPVHSRRASPQLTLGFHSGPGRPVIDLDRRRKPKSVTLAPEIIAHFDRWADKNHMSFSRGVEAAIVAFMQKG